MATCCDCVHYEMCNDLVFGGGISNSDAKGCKHFKPKSRYVELPCEVGQTVWIPFEGEATPLTIYRISIVEQLTEYNDGLIDDMNELIYKTETDP